MDPIARKLPVSEVARGFLSRIGDTNHRARELKPRVGSDDATCRLAESRSPSLPRDARLDVATADLNDNAVPDECEGPGSPGVAMELRASCKAGLLNVSVTRPDESSDGTTVLINLNGEAMPLRVVRRTAQYRAKADAIDFTICLMESNRMDACRTVHCRP